MAPELTIEDAVARARKAEERRIEAVRVLAAAQQNVATAQQAGAEKLAQAQREADEQTSAAEKENAKCYNDALAAGWTVADLRKIGFREPKKHARRRSPRRSTRAENSSPTEPSEQQDSANPTAVTT